MTITLARSFMPGFHSVDKAKLSYVRDALWIWRRYCLRASGRRRTRLDMLDVFEKVREFILHHSTTCLSNFGNCIYSNHISFIFLLKFFRSYFVLASFITFATLYTMRFSSYHENLEDIFFSILVRIISFCSFLPHL